MKSYGHELQLHQIYQSMSRKGNCLDNAPMENFFGLLKHEIYHGRVYRSYEELVESLTEYIRYYNEKRIKKSLDWMSPVEYRECHAVA